MQGQHIYQPQLFFYGDIESYIPTHHILRKIAQLLDLSFVKEMTAGRGFIALAALIFAKWRPWYALSACLLFGFLQAIALRYQNIDLGAFTVPVQVMDALPYILTVVILAGFVGKAVPPRAGGEPYVKER